MAVLMAAGTMALAAPVDLIWSFEAIFLSCIHFRVHVTRLWYAITLVCVASMPL
jgi:hypothetical protein